MTFRRSRIVAWLIGILLIPMVVHGQAADRIYRIGVLASPSIGYWKLGPTVFLYPLQDYGYERGKNLSFISKNGRGRKDANVSDLVAELIALAPDVIVATDLDAAVALNRATQTIPVVMLAESDPVDAGLVASMARPGGNVTGVSILDAVLVRKRLELLKAIAPKADKVCILRDRSYSNQRVWRAAQDAARMLGMASQLLEASDSDEELTAVFSQALTAQCKAIVMLNIFWYSGPMLIKQARESQIPVICDEPANASHGVGCLLAYGPEFDYVMDRLAHQVDRILKGTPPEVIPVEQPTQFTLAVNLSSTT